MKDTPPILLLPDAGPLITLAYAEALSLLFKPGWTVQIVDMVQHEVTRNQTPTSQMIADWLEVNQLQIIPTKTCQYFLQTQAMQASASASASTSKSDLTSTSTTPKKSNLGEFAIQEAMNEFALMAAPPIGVFLFEDHKIARSSFLLPDNCRKVSTRAFLVFLEQKGWISSATDIERKAILNGRNFSQLRFPPA